MKRTRFMHALVVVLGLSIWLLCVGPAEAIDLRDWGLEINNAANRFVLKFGGTAVLDRETQLVWEQSPDTNVKSWTLARSECTSRTHGDRKGWRLPSFHELASLVDPTQAGVSLLPGHPFSNVQGQHYWSATTDAEDSTKAWSVRFLQTAYTGTTLKSNGQYVWCVRGGSPGPDAY